MKNANEKEHFSDADKSLKSKKNKGIIKISSNFGKMDKSEDVYRGLARNLSGNKSFDNFRNGLASSSNLINKDDKTNILDKNNNHVNKKEVSININSNKNNINQDILERLLKEAEEDSKNNKNTKEMSIQNNKKSKVTEIKKPPKKININFNDENLLLISNILGKNKKVPNPSEEEDCSINKSNIFQRENNLAEGFFLINKNGIFKNKNENLKITSGLDVFLDEDIKKNSHKNGYRINNKADIDTNKREISVSGNDRRPKDRIIYKDAEMDKEKDIIAKKNKRNTVFLGKDADKKLNINNLNQSTKEIQAKKTDMNKRNSLSKVVSENFNKLNKNNLYVNNNQKQSKNEFEKGLKDSNNIKKYNEIKYIKNSEFDGEDSNPPNERYVKKLQFENINRNSNIIIERETKVKTPLKEKDINILLESKQIDSNKSDEMMVIRENEQILKDEIYNQRITKYEQELLIKKPIQFNNELNLDYLKVNSMSNEKQDKSFRRDSKKSENKSSNNNYRNNTSSDKGNTSRQESYYYEIDNEDNFNDYERELAKTNSNSILERSSNLNLPKSNFTKGGVKEKLNTPFNNLQKNAFDSRDESTNNSNNTLNKNHKLSQNQKKNIIQDQTVNKNFNSMKRNSSQDKRNSAREVISLKLKKNLIKDGNEIDLTDSLDTSINKNSKNKFRNSVDEKFISNRNYNNNNSNKIQVKNSNNDKINTKINSNNTASNKDSTGIIILILNNFI